MTPDMIVARLHIDTNRWPDKHGAYHADCPYCTKPAKKGQTHFTLTADGLCYCQVCQQGTTVRALAKHLGIDPDKTATNRASAIYYDYHNANEQVVYQVVRYYKNGQKQFYQRRPDGNGGWIKDMNGVDRVLYHLPDLIAAVKKGETVYIVEGEKDVEAMRLRGLTATTNPQGAGKWQECYNQYLKGASVVILPDNDEPGKAHARQVKQALAGIAASVQIVALAGLSEKGDVSDWFVAGHKIEEIQQVASKPTEYTEWKPNIISAADLYRKQFPQLVWLVDGILPEGLCLLAAKPKSKKSWLALGIAVGVAYGGKAFGYYDVMQGRVLYLDLESNQRRMKTRLRGIIGDRVAWPENFDIVTEWKRGDEGIAMLNAYVDIHPDTRLVVIDIWARFRSMRDPKADPYEQDYNALQALNAWAESRNVTVIVIHHTRKMKSDDVFEEISGTTGIVGAVATAMVLTRSPDTPDEQLLHLTGRDLITDDPIALKWDHYTCQHIYVATGAEASSSAERRAVLTVMEDDQEYHLKDLAALTKKTMNNLSNLLRRLMDDNLVQRTGRGRYAKVIIRDEVSEVREVSEIGVISEQFSTKEFTEDHASEIASEIGLGHQEALNDELHELHRDSHSEKIEIKEKAKIEHNEAQDGSYGQPARYVENAHFLHIDQEKRETPHERAMRLMYERSRAAGWKEKEEGQS